MGWTSGFLEITETSLAKHLIKGIVFFFLSFSVNANESIFLLRGVWYNFINKQEFQYANSADSVQTLRSAAYDLGLQCLPWPHLWDARNEWDQRNET